MRYFLLLSGFLLFANIAFSQFLYPDVMEIRELDAQPLKVSPLLFPKDLQKLKRTLKDNNIDNPGIRYTIQNLKKEKFQDSEINKALATLLRYAENDTLEKAINYLRDYIKTTGEKEDALRVLNSKLIDSVELYTGNTRLLATDYATYMNSDLRTLVSYVQQDSNFIWLKKVSRDSVLLEVMNAADSSIQLWMNNGKQNYHRFWAINRLGDSIGTWIQVLPPGNTIRIYVDDDVYQSRNIEIKERRKESLANRRSQNYFKIKQLDPGELRRRYWTYYSEVEMAVGQGYLVNWASGGENSLSMLSNLRYFINYNKNKTSWESFLHYRLGFLKSGKEELRKNEERLELNSKLGKKAFRNWFYTAQLNIQTMLFNSYEYSDDSRKVVANFMSPAYFTLSVGLDYKPNDHFSLYISPIAGKWTYVRDTSNVDPTRYGVEEGKKSKGDAGARVELRNKFKLFKIMDIRNELIMFSSYYNSQQNFTADWKVQIDFKINYFMRASVYTNAVYDKNYSKKLQFKENLNLGVNFRF